MKLNNIKTYCYIGTFVFCWLFYILMVDHDKVVSKYGILAYQPFNFLTIVLTTIIGGMFKIGFDMIEGKYSFWEGMKRGWKLSIIMSIIIIIILYIDYIIFKGEPGLFI